MSNFTNETAVERAERTGALMDEWHAQDGDTYATPAPNATAQLLRNIADHDAQPLTA